MIITRIGGGSHCHALAGHIRRHANPIEEDCGGKHGPVRILVENGKKLRVAKVIQVEEIEYVPSNGPCPTPPSISRRRQIGKMGSDARWGNKLPTGKF